jgi:hypothetical protein
VLQLRQGAAGGADFRQSVSAGISGQNLVEVNYKTRYKCF